MKRTGMLKRAAYVRDEVGLLMLARHARRWAWALAFVIGGTACADGDAGSRRNARYPADPNTMKTAMQMRDTMHRNGLLIKLPATLIGRETANGFIIEPAGNANAQVRRPTQVEVERRATAEFRAPANGTEKTIAGRTINYVVEEETGGSGGSEYELTAWESVPGGFIIYRQGQQAESAAPEFEMCWTVIEQTSLK